MPKVFTLFFSVNYSLDLSELNKADMYAKVRFAFWKYLIPKSISALSTVTDASLYTVIMPFFPHYLVDTVILSWSCLFVCLFFSVGVPTSSGYR